MSLWVEVVWACNEKRRRIRRQESDGDGGAGEKKERTHQEFRLKWYGHVMRREDEYVGKRVMVMEVPGKRRRGHIRKVG